MPSFTIIMMLFLSGCAMQSKHTDSLTISDLVNNQWILQHLSDEPVIKDTKITLSVSRNGKIRGHSGVNNYFGSWQLDGQKVKSSRMSATKKFALDPKGIMEQEQRYLGFLSKVTRWDLVGDELHLYVDNKVTIKLHRVVY